ncbi:serine/threonine protein kinase [Ktedonosporobacter rubrisoli]|uniref:non-specific serine/threonine protein kinase n=1 Tax=Ktedonosporobacter rubrisoli TaxID=2509675 RepID=A0A4P6K0K6_KTERU|nr:serine/threonine-protein kinase [Ktedonosporobacter rubrisoli]QBD81322.1 serine/threonine protein kinase [Ktedonosporobacter rubrisoli]
MTERVGQQFGNYRLVKLLGQGGFADVYLGIHTYLESQAAIKVLHTRLSEKESHSFLTEARTLIHLRHPHIIRVLDFGVEADIPFLVMDYAAHGTLRQRFPKGSRLSPAIILPYVKQLASALQYAHGQKLIHRDIKPENLLLQSHEEIVLSDFGIVLLAQSSQQSTKDITGTVTYMAPEQIRGRPQFASDQYAMGVLIYEWLCGKPPYQGSFTEQCTQHMFAAIPSLREQVPELSPALEYVVQTALAKEPQQRFGSIQAFATAFEQACAPEQVALPYTSYKTQPINGQNKRAEKPAEAPGLSPRQAAHSFYADDGLQGPPNMLSMATQTDQSQAQNLSQSAENSPSFPTASLSHPQKPLTPRRRPRILWAGLLLLVLLLVASSGLFYLIKGHQASQETSQKTTATVHSQSTPTSDTSKLSPTATKPPGVTPTTLPNITPGMNPDEIYSIATNGTPTLSSPLTKQDANNWDTTTYQGGGGCAFHDKAYHATMPQKGLLALCYAGSTNFGDLAFQANMSILSGANADGGGLIFRANDKGGFYRLRLGTDGTYDLVNQSHGLIAASSSYINSGVGQSNLITIVAKGPDIYMYVNKHFLAHIHDDATSYGTIGLFAVGWTNPTDVSFQDADVWQL